MPPSNKKPATVPSRLSRKTARVRKLARTIANGTLMAAALTATRLAHGEVEPNVKLFNMTIVDRLEEPLSRHHE